MGHYWDGNKVDEPKANGPAESPLTVETVDNHIYFYSRVNSDRCLAVTKQLRELDQRLQVEHITRGLTDEQRVPIWLHISSFGGDPFAGFSLADTIKQLRTPVYSVVEGVCASAATIFSVVCKQRYMQPSSFLLIHQFSLWFVGTHEQYKDEMVFQTMLMDQFVNLYTGHSKMSEADIRERLTHEFWMNPQQAMEYGFIDGVL